MCYCDGRRSAVMAIIYKREPKENLKRKVRRRSFHLRTYLTWSGLRQRPAGGLFFFARNYDMGLFMTSAVQ